MDSVSVGLLILVIIVGVGAIIMGIYDHRVMKRRERNYISNDLMCKMASLVVNCSLEFLCETAHAIPYDRYLQCKHLYEIMHSKKCLDHIVNDWKVVNWSYVESERGDRYILFITDCETFSEFICTDDALVRIIESMVRSKEKFEVPDVETSEMMDCKE